MTWLTAGGGCGAGTAGVPTVAARWPPSDCRFVLLKDLPSDWRLKVLMESPTTWVRFGLIGGVLRSKGMMLLSNWLGIRAAVPGRRPHRFRLLSALVVGRDGQVPRVPLGSGREWVAPRGISLRGRCTATWPDLGVDAGPGSGSAGREARNGRFTHFEVPARLAKLANAGLEPSSGDLLDPGVDLFPGAVPKESIGFLRRAWQRGVESGAL